MRRRGPRRAATQPLPGPRPATSAGRPGPGPGTVEPETQEPPSSPPRREPESREIFARFSTSWSALAFAEQVAGTTPLGNIPCARGVADRDWWIGCRLTLDAAREMAGLCAAELYVQTADGLVLDRGWGDGPGSGPSLPPAGLTQVPLLELVRTAGLHPVPAGRLRQAVVLLPGHLAAGLLQRALDLRLRADYQQVRLAPLFEESEDAASQIRVCYSVRLHAGPGQWLPAALLAALQDDPFALVCRSADQALLIRHGAAAPLSDRVLVCLVAAEGDQTWLLADPPDGCARLTWLGEPLDAANFVRSGPAHALDDLDGTQAWAEPPGQAQHPQPPTLTLVRVSRQAAPVDAVLLDDAELGCLAPLLAGEPLADIAFLVLGRDRHLLSAPGGLLTELPVGEPLTCIGPGSLYLPVGYRTDPPLPPTARAALFRTDASTARVLLPASQLVYNLDDRQPVWYLWAGPVPGLDPQLPRSALADLEQVEQESGQPPREPSLSRSLLTPFTRLRSQAAAPDPSAWREQAFRAEREGDYVAAAQLYSRHNEPLRAARLYERQAEESP